MKPTKAMANATGIFNINKHNSTTIPTIPVASGLMSKYLDDVLDPFGQRNQTDRDERNGGCIGKWIERESHRGADFVVHLQIITGIVSPPSATVTANGQEAQVARDGTFSITIELDYGENTIVVSATDPVTKTVTIVRLLTLELSAPQDKEEVSESQTVVSGTVSDPLVTVTVNDNEVEVAQDGTFTTTVELDYGENTIVASAVAEDQEPITKSVTITRVLALEITSPEDDAEVTESPILIRGTVSDPLALVTINDRAVEVAEDGAFSTLVNLDHGENTIVVNATLAGQETVTKVVTVRYVSAE